MNKRYDDIRIVIGADIVPTDSNGGAFCEGNLDNLIGSTLQDYLENADYIALNLETPITDKEERIIKCGPAHMAPTKSIIGLKRINPFFYTLANNHIMDQGESGIVSTVTELEKNGIKYAGVGKTDGEKARPHVAVVNGVRIGFYCCAEHEFSITGDNLWGANPYDPLVSFDHVKQLKEHCDLVVVLYHGGKEYYQYPSPEVQRVFHKFAETGADVVVAQHSHCIGCYEEYEESFLIYGQGNFLFDDVENTYNSEGILIEIIFNKNGINGGNDKDIKNISYIPVIRENNITKMADEARKAKILGELRKRSEEIAVQGTVEKRYNEYALKMSTSYKNILLGKIGKNIFIRGLNKVFHNFITNSVYDLFEEVAIENIIDCEAHRELILAGIKNKRKTSRH